MSFEYCAPATLAEASALAAQTDGTASFIAGGTDLVIQMRRQQRRPSRVIDLRGIPDLDSIVTIRDKVSLGALTTHRAVERCPAFSGALRGLIESAQVIGGHQVRNVATVGGNLCNASPAADLLPVLLTLEADAHLADGSGTRAVSLIDFLRGPGLTARRPDEVLTGVFFAVPPARSATAFIKIGRRRAMEISVASAAAFVTLGEDGRCIDVRLAAGAVAPTAMRLHAAEVLLRGERLTRDVLTAAGRTAAATISPLSDVRASAAYRRRLIEIAIPRAIEHSIARIEG